jgi:NTE family protein
MARTMSATTAPHPASNGDTDTILVLQGGGALGAYQGGVVQALAEAGLRPRWLAGISIGAINAALLAGNPAERWVERLHEFWQLLSSAMPPPPLAMAGWGTGLGGGLGASAWRPAVNDANALQGMLFGVPGFFTPRLPPPQFQPAGTPQAISYYDTAPLRATLERLIDFDRLNDGGTRLSVGAVNVRSGNFTYFDSARQRLDVRHIMASGALPPGFAPVEIDGEHYWDGGLVSNTPLQQVLDEPANSGRHRVVFQVDLFAAQGALPANLDEVTEREKDIRFSSRTRLNTTLEMERYLRAQAAQRLRDKLPATLRDDPDMLALLGPGCDPALDVVHLIYRSRQDEHQSKDYEFSRLSVLDHWRAGHADMSTTLADPRWCQRPAATTGVRVFDLAADGPGTALALKLRAG